MRDLYRFGETLGVCIEEPVDVFPDSDFLGIETVGEDGSSEVGALSS